jgi:hypothetical protein
MTYGTVNEYLIDIIYIVIIIFPSFISLRLRSTQVDQRKGKYEENNSSHISHTWLWQPYTFITVHTNIIASALLIFWMAPYYNIEQYIHIYFINSYHPAPSYKMNIEFCTTNFLYVHHECCKQGFPSHYRLKYSFASDIKLRQLI